MFLQTFSAYGLNRNLVLSLLCLHLPNRTQLCPFSTSRCAIYCKTPSSDIKYGAYYVQCLAIPDGGEGANILPSRLFNPSSKSWWVRSVHSCTAMLEKCLRLCCFWAIHNFMSLSTGKPKALHWLGTCSFTYLANLEPAFAAKNPWEMILSAVQLRLSFPVAVSQLQNRGW